MNTPSLLASLTLSKSEVLHEMYDVVAFLLNSGLGLSATHLRHIPVAFVGQLEFQGPDGTVQEEVVYPGPA